MMKWYKAYLSAHQVAEYLLQAHTLEWASRDHAHYDADAHDELKELAALMGYDLVKRESAKTEEAA